MAAAFAVLAVPAIAEGVVALDRLGVMARSVATVPDDPPPHMLDVGRLAVALQRMRIAEGRCVMCAGPSECGGAAARLQLATTSWTIGARGRSRPSVRAESGAASIRDGRPRKGDDIQVRRLTPVGAKRAAHALFSTNSADDAAPLEAFPDPDLDDSARAARRPPPTLRTRAVASPNDTGAPVTQIWASPATCRDRPDTRPARISSVIASIRCA